MKRLFFFILIPITFLTCTIKEKTGVDDSSPIVVVDPRIISLEKDSAYQAKQISDILKQIVALKKNDSIYNSQITSINIRLGALITRFSKDSTLQWTLLKPLSPLVPDVKQLTTRYTRDSARQWVYINSVLPLIPQFTSLTNRFKSDSTKQWLEINKLKGTSPVTQIPIMQSQIKTIQAKDLAQDKNIVANTSSINNIQDTISVLKVIVGTDFTLDANKKLIISKSGIDRIKASMPQQ